MQPTIEQAVAAHRAGKLEEAQSLYFAILQDQPKHTDANHNLGVIAASMNKLGAALPLLKTALENNPSQIQYWLSYIDVLIQAQQLDTARNVLEQGKRMGLPGEQVDALSERITLLIKNFESDKNLSASLTQQRMKQLEKKGKNKKVASLQGAPLQNKGPSQDEVNSILVLYKSRSYESAKKMGIELTQRYPNHQFGWKALGAIFNAIGKPRDALIANQKAAILLPTDVEAHNNLGNTLKELGKLAEAEASYRQAIALKPNLAEAHSNLGATLRELGRLAEAEASYRQAIILKPNLAETYSNLGDTLLGLGKPAEAEASFKKAITLKPGLAEAHGNLGNAQKDLGKLAEAEASYRQAIALKPDFAEARYNLGIFLNERMDYRGAAEQFIGLNFQKSRSYLLRCLYLQDEKTIFNKELEHAISLGENDSVIGSLCLRSTLKYQSKVRNPFCGDPFNYIRKINLTQKYDFKEIFVYVIKKILSEKLFSSKNQGLLTNGYQTAGDLFSIGSNDMKKIHEIIRSEIEEYRSVFKDSNEGLIKQWPSSYELKGWLINMTSGGELRPHIHEMGWISGSIYINVPEKKEIDSGNLVLCVDDKEFAEKTVKNPSKTVNVTKGDMVLFPANLMHYTIPFNSEESRIVLAFDVQKK